MPWLQKRPIFVTHYIRTLRGPSQSVLVGTSDGFVYVVKFANNPLGPNLLFNECMGTELYYGCGLPVPRWRALLVPDGLLDRQRECWLQTANGLVRPPSGLCFGSRFLGGEGVQLFEILPRSYFSRVGNIGDFWLAWLVDICAKHMDNRQTVFLRQSDGRLNATFIDHGGMFAGPKGDEHPHFRASTYLDMRIYEEIPPLFRNLVRVVLNLDVDRLWKTVDGIPDEWKTSTALGNFALCLEMLACREKVEGVIDAMVALSRQAELNELAPSWQPTLKALPRRRLRVTKSRSIGTY